MRLIWSKRAQADLARVFEFLAVVNRPAALRVVQAINGGVKKLREHPRLGERLDEFDGVEVRRIFVGNYEVRYEVQRDAVAIVRLWHVREDR